MTKREFFTSIINGELTTEVQEMAQELLTKLDTVNAKRSSKPSKTQIENEPIKKLITELATNQKDLIASNVATQLEVSTQKASALLRQLVLDGTFVQTDIKIPKKGKVKAYNLAD